MNKNYTMISEAYIPNNSDEPDSACVRVYAITENERDFLFAVGCYERGQEFEEFVTDAFTVQDVSSAAAVERAIMQALDLREEGDAVLPGGTFHSYDCDVIGGVVVVVEHTGLNV